MSDIEFDAFVSTLAGVLSEGSLPHNVERNLKGKFWCIWCNLWLLLHNLLYLVAYL